MSNNSIEFASFLEATAAQKKAQPIVLTGHGGMPLTDSERLVYSAFRLGVIREVEELNAYTADTLAQAILAKLDELMRQEGNSLLASAR